MVPPAEMLNTLDEGPELPASSATSSVSAVPEQQVTAYLPDADGKVLSDSLAPIATGIASVSVTPIKPIAAQDIRLQVNPSNTFASYKWLWSAECNGQAKGAIDIPESGIQGTDLGGRLGTTRFGKRGDPDNPNRQVLMFRPNMYDAYTASAPRCELTFSPSFNGKLPVNQDVWFAFGVRLQNWVVTSDEQILMQWHWSNGTIPLGPFVALSLKGNTLKIDSKYNANNPPSIATTTGIIQWQRSDPPLNKWTYFVFKARISTNSVDAPYLKVWRDGIPIVDYTGPLGYNYPTVTPYLKIGHYQWVASYNQWSPLAATKTVLYRTPALVQDPTGNYTEADLRQHVFSQ